MRSLKKRSIFGCQCTLGVTLRLELEMHPRGHSSFTREGHAFVLHGECTLGVIQVEEDVIHTLHDQVIG